MSKPTVLNRKRADRHQRVRRHVRAGYAFHVLLLDYWACLQQIEIKHWKIPPCKNLRWDESHSLQFSEDCGTDYNIRLVWANFHWHEGGRSFRLCIRCDRFSLTLPFICEGIQ